MPLSGRRTWLTSGEQTSPRKQMQLGRQRFLISTSESFKSERKILIDLHHQICQHGDQLGPACRGCAGFWNLLRKPDRFQLCVTKEKMQKLYRLGKDIQGGSSATQLSLMRNGQHLLFSFLSIFPFLPKTSLILWAWSKLHDQTNPSLIDKVFSHAK